MRYHSAQVAVSRCAARLPLAQGRARASSSHPLPLCPWQHSWRRHHARSGCGWPCGLPWHSTSSQLRPWTPRWRTRWDRQSHQLLLRLRFQRLQARRRCRGQSRTTRRLVLQCPLPRRLRLRLHRPARQQTPWAATISSQRHPFHTPCFLRCQSCQQQFLAQCRR